MIRLVEVVQTSFFSKSDAVGKDKTLKVWELKNKVMWCVGLSLALEGARS